MDYIKELIFNTKNYQGNALIVPQKILILAIQQLIEIQTGIRVTILFKNTPIGRLSLEIPELEEINLQNKFKRIFNLDIYVSNKLAIKRALMPYIIYLLYRDLLCVPYEELTLCPWLEYTEDENNIIIHIC